MNKLLLVLGFVISCGVHAQAYPNKPISMVVPQAAGGTNDIVARLIAPSFGEAIGTSIVVENRPGAGGNIGTQSVARSSKDGYTLLLTINSAQAINPSLYKNPGFDPVNDFAPLYYIGATPYVLVSPPGSPYKTLADVVAAAKKKPGELSYASAGNGTISHLLGAMLNASAGIEMQHIPYKGVAPAINEYWEGKYHWHLLACHLHLITLKRGNCKRSRLALQNVLVLHQKFRRLQKLTLIVLVRYG
jgi:tripartite-type tricarboxylate transporter receptor subunit TctC